MKPKEYAIKIRQCKIFKRQVFKRQVFNICIMQKRIVSIRDVMETIKLMYSASI